MNIAIVAPSPIPLVMGGAENLWLGLQRFFNEETSYHCELFKIPTRERNLLEVVASYREFSKLSLDGSEYDHLITGKYPAWMVQHSRHALYMLHPLRGLYDTYHFARQPTKFDYGSDRVRARLGQEVERIRGKSKHPADLDRFLDAIEAYFSRSDLEQSDLNFPGPIARDIVHALDEYALSPARIKTYAAISHTVRERAGYFPASAKVSVAYPPPRLEGFYCASDDHLFTTSRLDSPKRVALLIEAMRHVRSNIKLIIAGKGPEEEYLKTLANGDPRIQFAGYLSDSELLDHYAHALAVPFVPYDEDYGLITIEAMKSAKPVITTTDSGGVIEFVVDKQTGLVVPPTAKDLALAIDYVCDHRDKAKEMGRNGQRLVAGIGWRKVAEQLVGQQLHAKHVPRRQESKQLQGRLKMVVAVTFPVYPPRGGGQSRVYNLYRELAREFDIVLVTLGEVGSEFSSVEIAPNLVEIRVPKSSDHQRIEEEYSRNVSWTPVTDIVASRAIRSTPEYVSALADACASASIVVACHPFFFEVLATTAPNARLWYEAQDIEYRLKQDILPQTPGAQALLEMVKECEAKAWKEAEVVYTCSSEDLKGLEALYGPTKAYTLVVPNGFASHEVHYTTLSLRRAVKESLKLAERPTVVFMGSWHGPNLEAVKRVISYAVALPAISFIVIGSAGMKFVNDKLPANLRIVGITNEEEKRILLCAADLAVNPMTSGTGSNLKMLDYFASGVPVMSTAFGARGIDAEPSRHFIRVEIEDFIFEITRFFIEDLQSRAEHMRSEAAALAHSKYSWSTIAADAYKSFPLSASNL